MESTLDIEATRIPQLKTKQGFGMQKKLEQIYHRGFVQSFRDEEPRTRPCKGYCIPESA